MEIKVIDKRNKKIKTIDINEYNDNYIIMTKSTPLFTVVDAKKIKKEV